MRLLFLVVAFLYQSSAAVPSGRIIGGETAYAGQFPFAAAVYVETTNGKYFCGGSLIGPEWILTSAQCVDNATEFTIHLGSNNLNGHDDNRVIVSSNSYVSHPDYNHLTLENDVGLIKLRMPVTYTNYVQKVFMAYGNLSDYTNLLAIGWGQTSDMDPGLSNELKRVSVASLPTAECKTVYGNQIDDRMVCAEGEYNEGTCWGDTGSALVHMDMTTRSVRHVGIASFISGNGCEATDPSGFTRTYTYKSWITDVTGIIS